PLPVLDRPGFALGCCRGGDVGGMALFVSPHCKPAGDGGEHNCADGGDEEPAAESLLTLGCSLGVFRTLSLRLLRGLGGFTQATLVLHFILLALALGLLAGGQERPLDRIEFVAVRRNPFPTYGQARP